MVSTCWVILVTFLVGVSIVFFEYGNQGDVKHIFLFLYLFLEFLPMLVYTFAILLPDLSPHLLLPWILLNTFLLLLASILGLALLLPEPTITKVLLALIASTLLIFPALLVILMFLPATVYIKKLVPDYMKRIRRSDLYRRVTGTRSAEEIEREIVWRRKEAVRNTVITERDYEQFIFVSRAAQKWKSKLKKNRPVEEVKDESEVTDDKSGESPHIEHEASTEPLIANEIQLSVRARGHFATDV